MRSFHKVIGVILFTILVIIGVNGFAFAESYLPYVVVDVQENSFTIRNDNGREIVLNRLPKGLKIGDKVRYNKKKHILKRNRAKLK